MFFYKVGKEVTTGDLVILSSSQCSLLLFLLPQFEVDLYKLHQDKTTGPSLRLYCNIKKAINAKPQ